MSQSQSQSQEVASSPTGATAADPVGVVADHPHDFEVQKELHQKIRNDPDYDDWEYGTEPLPHEAWLSQRAGSHPAEPPA